MGDYTAYLEPDKWKALGISSADSLCKTGMETISNSRDAQKIKVDDLEIYAKSQRFDILEFNGSDIEQLPYRYYGSYGKAEKPKLANINYPNTFAPIIAAEETNLPLGVKLIYYKPDYVDTFVWVEKLTNLIPGFNYRREAPLKIWKYEKKQVRERLSVPNITLTLGSTEVTTDRPWIGKIKVYYYYDREQKIKEIIKESFIPITIFNAYMSPIGYDADAAEIKVYLLPNELDGKPVDELDCLLCNSIEESQDVMNQDPGGMVELINNARITHPYVDGEEVTERELLCEIDQLSNMAHSTNMKVLPYFEEQFQKWFFSGYIPPDFFYPGSESNYTTITPEFEYYSRYDLGSGNINDCWQWSGSDYPEFEVGHMSIINAICPILWFREYKSYDGSIFYSADCISTEHLLDFYNRGDYFGSWFTKNTSRSDNLRFITHLAWFLPEEDPGIDAVKDAMITLSMQRKDGKVLGSDDWEPEPEYVGNLAGSDVLSFSRSNFSRGLLSRQMTCRRKVYDYYAYYNGDTSEYEIDKDAFAVDYLNFYMITVAITYDDTVNECPEPINLPSNLDFTCSPECLNRPCEWYQPINETPKNKGDYYYLSPEIVMPCYVPWICALKSVVLFTEFGGRKAWTAPQFGLSRGFGDVDHENPYVDLKNVNFTVSWGITGLEPFMYPGEYFYFMYEVSFDENSPCQFLYGPHGYFETHCLTSGSVVGCGFQDGSYGGYGFERDDSLFWSFSPNFRWLIFYKGSQYWIKPSDYSYYSIGDRVFIFKSGSTVVGDSYIPCRTGDSFDVYDLYRGIPLSYTSVTYDLDVDDRVVPLSLANVIGY